MIYKLIVVISIISVSLSETIDSDRINSIRKSLIAYYSKNPSQAYQSDIALLAEKEWLINSFLLPDRSNQEVEEAIKKSLLFWKDIEILSLNDTYFPSELIATGFLYLTADTSNTNQVLGYIGQCHIASTMVNPYLLEINTKFLYYKYRNFIFKRPKNSTVLVISMANLSFGHNNIGITSDVVRMVMNNSPKLVSKVLVIDIGILIYVFKPFIAVLGNQITETLTFISRNELQKYISLDSIPVYAGGTDSKYRRMPEGVKSGKCLEQFKDEILPQEWDQFRDKNIDCILNGLEESKLTSLEDYLKYC